MSLIFNFSVEIKGKTSVSIDEKDFDPKKLISDIHDLNIDQQSSYSVLIEENYDFEKVENDPRRDLWMNDCFREALRSNVSAVLEDFIEKGDGDKSIDDHVYECVKKVNFYSRFKNGIHSNFLFDVLYRFNIDLDTTVTQLDLGYMFVHNIKSGTVQYM